jgi:hypothetical protein
MSVLCFLNKDFFSPRRAQSPQSAAAGAPKARLSEKIFRNKAITLNFIQKALFQNIFSERPDGSAAARNSELCLRVTLNSQHLCLEKKLVVAALPLFDFALNLHRWLGKPSHTYRTKQSLKY